MMLNRIFIQNIFLTLIKTNIDQTIIKELELPLDKDQYLQDVIIPFLRKKGIETTINQHILRLATVYRAEDNKGIHILTNNLDWMAGTIADFYIKKQDIELFFKAMKQHLRVKKFLQERVKMR